jgi:hypothetical protein
MKSKYNDSINTSTDKTILVAILKELEELNSKLTWGKIEEIEPAPTVKNQPVKSVKKI